MLINTTTLPTVPKGDIEYFAKISHIFALFAKVGRKNGSVALPGRLKRVFDISPECHTISIAISMLIPEMKVRHGVYLGFNKNGGQRKSLSLTDCAHSWNVAPGGTIIDSYPVGVINGGPVIVVSTGTYQPFGANLYIEGSQILKKLPMFKIWSRAALLADVILYVEEVEETKAHDR